MTALSKLCLPHYHPSSSHPVKPSIQYLNTLSIWSCLPPSVSPPLHLSLSHSISLIWSLPPQIACPPFLRSLFYPLPPHLRIPHFLIYRNSSYNYCPNLNLILICLIHPLPMSPFLHCLLLYFKMVFCPPSLHVMIPPPSCLLASPLFPHSLSPTCSLLHSTAVQWSALTHLSVYPPHDGVCVRVCAVIMRGLADLNLQYDSINPD